MWVGAADTPFAELYGMQIVPSATEEGQLSPDQLMLGQMHYAQTNDLNKPIIPSFDWSDIEPMAGGAGVFEQSPSCPTMVPPLLAGSNTTTFIKLEPELDTLHFLDEPARIIKTEERHITKDLVPAHQPTQTVVVRTSRPRTKRKATPYEEDEAYSPSDDMDSPSLSPRPFRPHKASRVQGSNSIVKTNFRLNKELARAKDEENATPKDKAVLRLLRMFPRELLQSSSATWKATVKDRMDSLSTADQKTLASLRRKELSCVYAEKARQTRIQNMQNYAASEHKLKSENHKLREINQQLREELNEMKAKHGCK